MLNKESMNVQDGEQETESVLKQNAEKKNSHISFFPPISSLPEWPFNELLHKGHSVL